MDYIGTYRIKSSFSGKVLVPLGHDHGNNAKIVQFHDDGSGYYLWELYKEGDHYRIKNKKTQKYIGPYGRDTGDNARIIQYEYQDEKYQHWEVDHQRGLIKNLWSNKYLVPEGNCKFGDGNEIVQYHYYEQHYELNWIWLDASRTVSDFSSRAARISLFEFFNPFSEFFKRLFFGVDFFNFADHVGVMSEEPAKDWGCFADVPKGDYSRQLVAGKGNVKLADSMVAPEETPNLIYQGETYPYLSSKYGNVWYALNGVCHQAANRIALGSSLGAGADFAGGYEVIAGLGTKSAYGVFGIWFNVLGIDIMNLWVEFQTLAFVTKYPNLELEFVRGRVSKDAAAHMDGLKADFEKRCKECDVGMGDIVRFYAGGSDEFIKKERERLVKLAGAILLPDETAFGAELDRPAALMNRMKLDADLHLTEMQVGMIRSEVAPSTIDAYLTIMEEYLQPEPYKNKIANLCSNMPSAQLMAYTDTETRLMELNEKLRTKFGSKLG